MIVGANKPWQYMQGDILLPWYTLTCLEWLTKQDVSKWIVFEFGCGYSTIWWRLNAYKVTSVDSNEQWAKAMDAIFIDDKNEYTLSAGDEFDCIIIDGAWRLECLQNSHDRVRQGCYIIIDNWNGEDFPYVKEAMEILIDWEMQIFKQPNHSKWITAVFKKP